VAAFGKKDYQQLMVIRQLVRQFALPIQILAGETQRSPEGLALSSRNGYLSEAERSEALQLSLALRGLAQSAQSLGHALPEKRIALEQKFMDQLRARGWQPDYLTVRQRNDLQPPNSTEPHQELVVLGAARLGKTRLIDNFEI
jgi:pantoate--beta-alanine ligase